MRRIPDRRTIISISHLEFTLSNLIRALDFTMSVLGRRGASDLRNLAVSGHKLSPSALRPFSVLNRPPPNYPGHVPLTTIERGALAVGSAIGSLINPRRAGMYRSLPFPGLFR